METREFLDRVLPLEGGQYFGASIGPDDRYKQNKLDSIDALAAYIESRNKQRHNVYFATGVYDDRREAKFTQFKKALYLDIDTGDGKPYATKKEAVGEVLRFVKDTGFLRPNIIVDSGNGIHCYWVLDAVISLRDWLVCAEQLRQRCADGSLDVDSKVTTDAARILRVPGTVNYKNPSDPKTSKVIYSIPREYTIGELREALDVPERTGALAALHDVGGGDGEDLAAGVGFRDEPRYAAHMVQKCKVLKNTLATGGSGQVEPLWMHQLQLLAFTEDGEEYIHQVSDGHEAYDFRRTEKKFAVQQQKVVEKTVGPIRCSTLGLYDPESCDTCQWKGHITTPIQLGKEASDMPYGWKQDEKSIYRVSVATDKETGQSVANWEKVLAFTMADVSIYQSVGEEKQTVFEFDRTAGSHSATYRLLVTESLIRNPAAVANAQYGIALTKSEGFHFKDLIVSFQQQMEKSRTVRLLTPSLGWQKLGKEEGFVLPAGAHMPDGSIEKVVFKDTSLRDIYAVKGERQVWLDISHSITAQNRHANNAAMLASFASPLMRFSGVNSGLLSVYSPESGTGKSTAILVGQAIWGDPVKGVNSLSDTPNSVIHKLGYINNLPAYWDEVRLGREPTQFLNMIFQLSQGKERSRLNVDITQRATGTWRTMFVVATNSSLRDHADVIDTHTTASKLRIFEVEVPTISDEETLDIFPPDLHNNYGHIGVEYAKYLASNASYVEAVVKKAQAYLTKKLDVKQDERFWLATTSTLLAAAIISSKLGYTKVDPKAFGEWLINEYRKSRACLHREDAPKRRSWDWVTEYLASHSGQMVVTDHLSGRDKKGFGNILYEPKHGTIIGTEGGNRIRLMRKSFSVWLYKQGADPTAIIKLLKIDGAVETRAQYTGGTQGQANSRVWCVEFDKPDE
tara:strand:- start:5215 stop:7941 length:2727 start_codon:yes stop_codon:yes gene_type:complete